MNEILNRIAKAQTEHQLNASQADFLAELAARVEALEKLPTLEDLERWYARMSQVNSPAVSGGPQREQGKAQPRPITKDQESALNQGV